MYWEGRKGLGYRGVARGVLMMRGSERGMCGAGDRRGRAGRPSKEIVLSKRKRKQEYNVNREVFGVRTPLRQVIAGRTGARLLGWWTGRGKEERQKGGLRSFGFASGPREGSRGRR